MTSINLPADFLKPRRKALPELPRRRVPHIEAWSEYRAASVRSANEPGPIGEAARQGALRFAADRMPDDLASVYFDDLHRRRR